MFGINYCSNNEWDNGTHGNYWGNYTIKYPNATNDKTFWDTPYMIDGDCLGVDNFPLVNPVILKDSINISGFPLLNLLIFVSVGVFLLRKRISQ